MFRAAVLSIVLALASGPNVSLLCSIWCHQAATARCAHSDATGGQTIAASDTCQMTVGTSTAYVREDVRRGGSPPEAQSARHVAAFESGPPPVDAVSVAHAGPCLPLAAHPVVLSLRI